MLSKPKIDESKELARYKTILKNTHELLASAINDIEAPNPGAYYQGMNKLISIEKALGGDCGHMQALENGGGWM